MASGKYRMVSEGVSKFIGYCQPPWQSWNVRTEATSTPIINYFIHPLLRPMSILGPDTLEWTLRLRMNDPTFSNVLIQSLFFSATFSFFAEYLTVFWSCACCPWSSILVTRGTIPCISVKLAYCAACCLATRVHFKNSRYACRPARSRWYGNTRWLSHVSLGSILIAIWMHVTFASFSPILPKLLNVGFITDTYES